MISITKILYANIYTKSCRYYLLKSGERIVLSQDFEEVVVVPTGFETIGFDPRFDGSILFEQVEGDMSQHGEVFGTMILAQLILIHLKGDVQNPIQSIFDPEVLRIRRSNRSTDRRGWRGSNG